MVSARLREAAGYRCSRCIHCYGKLTARHLDYSDYTFRCCRHCIRGPRTDPGIGPARLGEAAARGGADGFTISESGRRRVIRSLTPS